VAAAASILLANCILKAIPARWLAKLPSFDESKSLGGSSKLMTAYESQANAKAFKKKEPSQAVLRNDDEYQE